MHLTLKIYKRDQLRQSIRLEPRNYLIGRGLTCDIVIPDNRVSRKHCSIIYEPQSGQYFIYDLNSKAGTYVDGARLSQELLLTPGMSIRFGSSAEFMLELCTDSSKPLIPEVAESEPDSRVSGQMEVGAAQLHAEVKQLRRRLTSGGLSAGTAEVEAALRFYELSVKMSLALYPQQEFQIMADHLFETTPADRLLMIRLNQGDDQPIEADLTSSDSSIPFEYSLQYVGFRPDAARFVREAGEHFSRRMLLRAIRSSQAILFSSADGSQYGGSIPTSRSSICAPLVGHQTTLGVLYLDVYSRESQPFTTAHLQMVSLAAYFFSIYLERERAVETKRESERLSSAGLAVFGAAHHIKNIMTSLQGSNQLIDGMVKRNDFTCLPETWGVMQRSIERITRAVGEMLNFAKEEHFESRPLDLPRLLEELVTVQRGRAQLAGVKLELFLERRSLTVMGDSQRIEEVIENLLTNAIECFESPRMPADRTPMVKVSMKIVGVRFVLVEVADNGPGIPPDSQRKIFDLFHTTKGAKGNGLGLAISRKHIRQHGGSLSYRTSPEGTAFRISLPLPGNDMDLPTNTAH